MFDTCMSQCPVLLPLLHLTACAVPDDDAGDLRIPVDEAAPADAPHWAPGGGAPRAVPPPEADLDAVVTREAQDVVRFVALGDAGTGASAQYSVARAIATVCAQRGCDFAIYLGDNFYDTGVDEVEDWQFEDKFELPYAALDFPFYPTLGNHDYGGNGAGYEFWKAPLYVDYSDRSEKWVFPAQFFRVDAGVVELYSLDTNAMVWGFYEEQLAWLQERTARTTATWTVAYGHHPYLSNGPHGNAGSYDGAPASPIGNGTYVKQFMDDAVCGTIDLYLCGHDHSRQWLVETCAGTELVVSGAGAKTTSVDDTNETWFQESSLGFYWVEVSADRLTGAFYDSAGQIEIERTLTK